MSVCTVMLGEMRGIIRAANSTAPHHLQVLTGSSDATTTMTSGERAKTAFGNENDVPETSWVHCRSHVAHAQWGLSLVYLQGLMGTAVKTQLSCHRTGENIPQRTQRRQEPG